MAGCGVLMFVALVRYPGPLASAADHKSSPAAEVDAQIQTSLPCTPQHRPELALDGDLETYFQSSRPPTDQDDFSLTLSRPTSVKSIEVITGKPGGSNRLDQGTLDVSADGKTFREAGSFASGRVRIELKDPTIVTLRIHPQGKQVTRLAIAEIVLDSAVRIRTSRVLPRILVDTTEVPDLDAWGGKARKLCEHWYPLINDMLHTDGFEPPYLVEVKFHKEMKGVAFTSGATIHIAAGWVKSHPDDLGMVIHELTHVVQGYPRNQAGWLVEGIADYVRHTHYEPEVPMPPINLRKASYRDGYKTTASFLAWIEKSKDRQIVRKVNQALRQGTYRDELFEDATGKSVDDLWQDYLQTKKKK